MKVFEKTFAIATAFAAATIATSVIAQEGRSKQSDAVALVKKAQEYIKANGLEKAYAEFNNLEGPFNVKSAINPHGDLYMYNMDFNGLQLVHGKNAKIRGKVMIDMRDQEGVYIIKGLVEKCKSPEGKGWVDYRWPHPISKTLESKQGYIERVPGYEACIGTGIYKE
jgi:cytochrome c